MHPHFHLLFIQQKSIYTQHALNQHNSFSLYHPTSDDHNRTMLLSIFFIMRLLTKVFSFSGTSSCVTFMGESLPFVTNLIQLWFIQNLLFPRLMDEFY